VLEQLVHLEAGALGEWQAETKPVARQQDEAVQDLLDREAPWPMPEWMVPLRRTRTRMRRLAALQTIYSTATRTSPAMGRR
jgi:hypothetical protein